MTDRSHLSAKQSNQTDEWITVAEEGQVEEQRRPPAKSAHPAKKGRAATKRNLLWLGAFVLVTAAIFLSGSHAAASIWGEYLGGIAIPLIIMRAASGKPFISVPRLLIATVVIVAIDLARHGAEYRDAFNRGWADTVARQPPRQQ